MTMLRKMMSRKTTSRKILPRKTSSHKVLLNIQQMSLYQLLKSVFTIIHLLSATLATDLFNVFFKSVRPTTSHINVEIINIEITKNPNRFRFRNERGFTLVELMVTVTVLAIIAMTAIPAISTQLSHMEAKRIRYQITNTLSTAKAESLIRRKDLLVCLSDSTGDCNKTSKKTLLLFIDNDDDQHFDTAIDTLLAKQQLNPKYGILRLHAGKRHYVKFRGDSGKPRGFFGHIKYCASSIYSQTKYQISFNQSGIIKYKPHSTHDSGC